MKIKRISKGEMPPANKYVLIYCGNSPWRDSTDQNGVRWKVAKCIYGDGLISGNNKVPYLFSEFGPARWFGQEIDIWCELPALDREGEREDA